jgi:hypothetical protein
MNMSKKQTNTGAELAKLYMSRVKVSGIKGRARDRAACDYFVGAASAAALLRGEKSPEYSQLSLLAFLVATRGYGEVEAAAQSVDANALPHSQFGTADARKVQP